MSSDEEALTHGPLTRRKCKDIFWLLLFILFYFGMGFVGFEAITTGSIYNLIYPKDSSGNYCGFDNSKLNSSQPDLSSSPNLFFINPTEYHSKHVCISSCPTTTENATVSSAICFGQTVTNDNDLAIYQSAGVCSIINYKSSPVFSVCIPSNISDLEPLSNSTITSDILSSSLSLSDLASDIVGDFSKTWIWFLAFAGFSIFLSFFYIMILRYFVGLFVWFVLLISMISVDGLAVFFYYSWRSVVNSNNEKGYSTTVMKREQDTYFGFFIASCVVAVLVNLLIISLRGKIRTSVQVIKEACKAVEAIPRIFLFSIFVFVTMLGLFSYWVGIELLLASANKNPNVQGVTFDLLYLKYFQWYLLLGFFWGQQFLSGINQVCISGAVATWYWTMDKRALPSAPLMKSIGRTFRYHLGSIAIGSLLVAVVEFIKSIIDVVQRRVKGAENRPAKFILTCCSCCFNCLEFVLKFINKNSYIEIAMNGHGFGKASYEAFNLLVRNAFRLVAVESVTGFIFFLGKLIVVCFSGAGAHYLLNYYYSSNPLNYVSASVFVIMIIAYVVTSIFLFVFDIAIDTIFLSFCEDCEKNDGSSNRPFYMSPELQALLSVKNVEPIWANNKVGVAPDSRKVTKKAFLEDDDN